MDTRQSEALQRGRVVVIGGGAAGLIAAMRAAECGASVLLLEKNERLGTKILISGGGKCNVTHAGPMEQLRGAFRQNEALFLKPSFYRYSNQDFVKLLQTTGLVTTTRDDGRIFPREPGNAKDVVAVLEGVVRRKQVEVRTCAGVTGIHQLSPNRLEVTFYDDAPIIASQVVVAVGGSSYPATGTTGDGWRWLEALGHTVVPPRAALAPIYLRDAMPDWSGVALRDVELRARTAPQGKIYARWRGDLLFTHKGVSGPCALGISREVAVQLAKSAGREAGILDVDLRIDTAFETLVSSIRSEMQKNPRQTLSTLMADTIPNRLIDPILWKIELDGAAKIGQLSQKAVTAIVRQLKEWNLGEVRGVPLERGEVVAGGISLDEVDPKTMASKLISGLYLCGEILDIAGPVGGYNLQAAWSTGYVAGESAALAAAVVPEAQLA